MHFVILLEEKEVQNHILNLLCKSVSIGFFSLIESKLRFRVYRLLFPLHFNSCCIVFVSICCEMESKFSIFGIFSISDYSSLLVALSMTLLCICFATIIIRRRLRRQRSPSELGDLRPSVGVDGQNGIHSQERTIWNLGTRGLLFSQYMHNTCTAQCMHIYMEFRNFIWTTSINILLHIILK